VERDGEHINVEVEHLTDEEIQEIIGSRSSAEIMDWLTLTCATLRLAEIAIDRLTVDSLEENQNER